MVVTWLIELVRCPKCNSRFQTITTESERVSSKHSDIIEGKLVCDNCGASYFITGGVPVFVD